MPELNDNVTTMLPKNPEKFIQAWMKEIQDAQRREKKYRELAKHCVKLYEAKNPEETPFNILYSNTETLVPAIYNSLPIPIVQRKFKDPDPVGRAVSEVSTRTLKFLLDNENQDYDCFDDLIQAAVIDGVVTNRGLCRFRYSANADGYNECVYGDSVRWDKFLHGYARSWKKVPWIAFEWDFSRDELKSNFPKAKFDDLRFSVNNADEDGDSDSGEDKDEMAGVKTYKVFEVWDKVSRKLFFISPMSKEILRYADDPLGLSSFFPVPKPLNFMRKITTLVPTPMYEQYKQQAAELNTITQRLKSIIKAIRFRGIYNAAVEGIEKALAAEENDFVPVENMQSMPDGTGMDKVIWTIPINELAASAQSLYTQREQCKQVIYEITGISDILRGASMASETATAQTIKNQWGTLRLKRMQREVQRYCRDSIAIILEIAAAKFEQQTFSQMTGLPYLTDQQKQQIQAQIQLQQAKAQAMAALPPPPGQPPQPPAPPQIPPDLQVALQSPSWDDILKVMHNRIIFHYKVDIETNSTIDAEAAQDKQDIAELMNAIAQFLNGVSPLVEQGVLSMDIAKNMLLVIARRYNFGSQLEDSINQMQPPKPQQDPNAAAKAQVQSAQINLENLKAEHATQQANMDMQLKQQEFEHKQALMVMEHNMKMADAEAKTQASKNQLANLVAKSQASALEHEQRLAFMKADAASADSGESD